MIDRLCYIFPRPSGNLERAAFFIAGQAFVARSEGLSVTRAVVVNNGREARIDVDHPRVPATDLLRSDDGAINSRKIIRTSLAGSAAQNAYGFGRYCRRLFSITKRIAPSRRFGARYRSRDVLIDTVTPFWPHCGRKCRSACSATQWPAIIAVAETLIRDGKLSGTGIAELANAAIHCT